MWQVIYYKRPNGRQPAKKWIDDQDNSIRPSIDTRLEQLEKEETNLLIDNGMLVPVTPKRKGEKFIPGFYELKHKGKKWRIATYHDLKRDRYVLLCGWRKTQQIQEWDVDKARTLLLEYLSTEGGIE